MSTSTLRHVKTEDGTLFKIRYHGAANFSYVELHQYDGDQFNEIEDWDLRTTEIAGVNVRNRNHDRKKNIAANAAEDYIRDMLMKDIDEVVEK